MRETVEYRSVESPGGLPAVADLIGEVYGSDYGPPMPADLLAAIAYAGGFIGGAFVDEVLVGTVIGFGEVVGAHPGELPADRPGHRHALHSHVAAVDPRSRGLRIGQGLKWFQRQWAIEHGIDIIRWTFDPLVRRNAVINLNRLGATAENYIEDFYGVIDDALNAGQETDRLVANWEVAGERTLAAMRGERLPPPQHLAGTRIETPHDIEGLVATDPDSAKAWRRRQRASFARLPADWQITGVDAEGCYIISTPS